MIEMPAPKNRITNAEATVAQKTGTAARQERAVFVPALTFLVTFCVKTKSNIKSLKI